MTIPNFPASARTTSYNTHDIEPTGDPTIDTPRWEALVSVVNSLTPAGRSATIRIRDNGNSLALDSAYSAADGSPNTSEFLSGCFVRGETKNARIEFSNSYIINWGRYGKPMKLDDSFSWFTRGTMAATLPFSSRVVPTGVTLAKGDWVCVWSDDNIPGVAAHHGNSGFQRAAELHRVNHEDAGGWVLDGAIVDPLTTNPRICKVEMMRGCGMADLVLGSTHVETSQAIIDTPQISSINIQRCLGFIVENCLVDDTGCGGLDTQLCADSRISGYNGVWQVNSRRNYAVTIGICNNVVFQDSVWHNCRHMITSAGMDYAALPLVRFGTARACKGINLHQYISGDAYDNAYAAMDLHAESWGFELNNCHVYNAQWWDSSTEEFFAFSTRARNTRFIGCHVHSAMGQTATVDDTSPPPPTGRTAAEKFYGQPANGWRIMANDALISKCTQDRGWRGVLIQNDLINTTFVPQRTHIEHCSFENISGAVVWLAAVASNGIEVTHSNVRNCGAYYVPAGVPQFNSAIFRIRNGTGHKIMHNNLDKYNNNYVLDCDTLTSSDFDIAYNSCRGYGSGKLGVRGDTGDPKGVSTSSGPSINTAFAGKNNVDA